MKRALGQRLIVGLKGTELFKDEAEFIVRANIGGVILFARNVESPKQVRQLCADVQSLRHRMADKAPLFISVDNEGGRVMRMKAPFTEWPAQAQLGKIDSTSVAFKFASDMAEELRAVGVNLNFAPCVDVLLNPANPAIGDRSLGADPERVAKLASALVRGFIKGGVLPCAKHFPGHGNTAVDSHFELPVEKRTLDELRAIELTPFKKAMRARLDFVMVAHILFSSVDPSWPSSLSPAIYKILRDELRFRGLVITDDMGMKAIAAKWSVGDAAVQAISAGADLLCYCNDPDAPPAALEALERAVADKRLDATMVESSAKRILDFKRAKLPKPDPATFEQVARVVGHPDHLKLAAAIASGSVPEELVSSANNQT